MAGKYDIGPRIGIDGEAEYRKQIADINESMRLLGSEMEKAVVSFGKNDDKMAELNETSIILNKQIDAQKEKIESMRAVLERAKDEFGENSSEVKRYQTSLNKAETELKKSENALEDVNEQLEKGSKNTGKFSKSLTDLSSDSEKLDGVLSSASLAVGAVVASMVAAVKASEEFRMDFGKLETNAQLAGQSVTGVTDELTKLQAVTGETDSNVEALSNLLKAGYTDDNLTRMVNELSGAVVQFPDTLKIESLADSLQETLATGAGTGQFGELLERAGMDLDTFNSGLQKCTTSAEKQDYVFQQLSKLGLSDAFELYKKNNEELFGMAEVSVKSQLAMAKIGESLTEAFVSLSPVIVPIIDGLANLISIISELPPEVVAVGATFAAMIPITLSVLKATKGVTELFGGKMNPTMTRTTAIIMGIVAALAALAAAIAVIMGKGNELKTTTGAMGQSIGNMSSASTRRYAVGTSYHPGGMALVGEQGPELVSMPRGSKVYTASQTESMLNSGTTIINNNTFKVDDIETYIKIQKRLESERQSQRAGYVRV